MAELRMRDGDRAGQATDADRDLVARSQRVDRYLQMLREAVTESGWTLDALASHLGFDRGHLHRLLSGDKPWRVEHLVALPPEVDAAFSRKRAEAHGLIVVERVDSITAEHQLASGLFNVLTRRLPERADHMAKCEPPRRQMVKASIR
jgi:hypothetical protein